MRSKLLQLLLVLPLFATPVAAQVTEFTYQGRLADAGQPASGSYDLEFAVFDALNAGAMVAGPLTNLAVVVSNGIFTTTLDFGAGPFDGNARWLGIGVRTNGAGAFSPLVPRQPISAAPYAITAARLSGVVSNASITGVYSNAVAFNNPANEFTGTFLGNGIGLSNVNATTLGGLSAGQFWKTGGNAGTTAGSNFVGTSDSQPLHLKVGGIHALRLEPDPRGSDVPNIIGGYSGNNISTNVGGGGNVIVGGGYSGIPNLILSNSSGVFIGAGSLNVVGTNASDTVIAGGFGNTVEAYQSVIGGGGNNAIRTVSSGVSVIAGGSGNVISNAAPPGGSATIGGGFQNRNSGWAATIAGGWQNIATGVSDFVGGGSFNSVSNNYSSVVGGYANAIKGQLSFIGGGSFNTNQAANSVVIAGGSGHLVESNATSAVISGGANNRVYALRGTIGGGVFNVAEGGPAPTVSGGDHNVAGGHYTAVGGGLQNTAIGYTSTIGGGGGNVIETNADHSTIAGGLNNVVFRGSFRGVIGGGQGNMIDSNVFGGTIAGGIFNRIASNASYAVIAGGLENLASNDYASVVGGFWNSAAGYGSFIGGGGANTNLENTYYSTIGAGYRNLIEPSASYSVIGGGERNTIQIGANYATLGGGQFNTVAIGSIYGTVPGGESNSASSYAFAAGRNAKANHQGSFVWADSAGPAFSSGANNQFSIRAAGGVRLVTSGAGLTVDGEPVLSGSTGPGSGLDADLLDGLNSTAFALAGHNHNAAYVDTSGDTMTGTLEFAAGATPLLLAGHNNIVDKRMWIGHSASFPSWGIQYRDIASDGYPADSIEFLAGNQTRPRFGFSLGGGTMTINNNVGTSTITLDGGNARVGIGRTPILNTLEVEGNASKTAAGSWLANSDRRIKEKIRPLTNALDVINRVRPVGFHYTESYRSEHPTLRDTEYYNVVAQEFQKVFPDSVQPGGDKLPGNREILQVDTYPAMIYSIAALQELGQQVKEKADRIAELETRNTSLEHRLAALEKLVTAMAAGK